MDDGDFRYVYGRAWNWLKWTITPFPESEARSRYDSTDVDDWFSVVAFRADDPDQDVPSFVLEVRPRAEVIVATFYLPSRSQSRSYVFEQRDGRMFMKQATQWFYPDEEEHYRLNRATLIEWFFFEPDGIVTRRVDDKSSPNIDEMSYRDVDVADNWEDVPAFGDWARFGREQR